MIALAIGVALAVCCFGYVLAPVLRAPARLRSRVSSSVNGMTDDDIEAAVSAYRRRSVEVIDCRRCGPRPEADARFCSNCGRPVREG